MLEKNFINIYSKFKMEFYKKIFTRLEDRETTLSAVEIFCVEAIYALGNPTIQVFANFIGISSPNAAYKVNSLIKKGYVKKVQSKTDKREFHLEVSEKFLSYYGLTYGYTETVVKRINQRFTPEEVVKFDEFLRIISEELMPEVKLSNER